MSKKNSSEELSKTGSVDSNIVELRRDLDLLGIKYVTTDSVADLARKLSSAAKRINEKNISAEADSAELKIKRYLASSNLTSEDLVSKIVLCGIPQFYVEPKRDTSNPKSGKYYIFEDSDVNLTKEDLWEKVRFSGHCETDFNQTMHAYALQPKAKLRG